jgi:hypothetical protein
MLAFMLHGAEKTVARWRWNKDASNEGQCRYTGPAYKPPIPQIIALDAK